MHKYRLKDFEFSINPNTWNSAQDLAQAGAVKALREVEKNFWVAAVDTPEGSREVEVIITPQKIKAYTCECWSEDRRFMCPHIAAVLLKIRQYLEHRQEERQKLRENRQDKASNRLTVQSVLEDVPREDLLEFVKNYARRDRDFSLALKTWFAGQLKGHQNPFVLILESAIPGTPMRTNERRRLRKTLDDLIVQLETAVKEGYLQRVTQITVAIVEKIAPLRPKSVEWPESELLHYCHLALNALQNAAWYAGSPESQEALWQTLCRWVESAWFPQALNTDLIRLMYKYGSRPGRFEDIERMFDNAPSPVPDRLLQLYIAVLAGADRPEAVVKVLEHTASQPASLLDTIRLLQGLHLDKAALAAAEFIAKHHTLHPTAKRELEDRILQLAERLSDRPQLLFWLRKRFIESGSTEIFQRLKQASGTDWPSILSQLLQELQERGDRRRLAALFIAEKEFKALESLLQHCTDTDLLDLYAGALSDEFLYTRYKEVLSEYLHEHFGKPAAMYVRQTLGGLLKTGKNALVRRIIQDLTEQFSDRPSLPEELAELFPGMKKAVL